MTSLAPYVPSSISLTGPPANCNICVSQRQRYEFFGNLQRCVMYITLVLILLTLGFHIIWTFEVGGSVSITAKLHSTIMVATMFAATGICMLLYNIFRSWNYSFVTFIHGLMSLAILGVGLFGVIGSAFTFPASAWKRTHSWHGIAVLFTLIVECVIGIYTVILYKRRQKIQSVIRDLHVAIGVTLYLCMIGMCVSGYSWPSDDNSEMNPWTTAITCLMLFIGILVTFLLNIYANPMENEFLYTMTNELWHVIDRYEHSGYF